MGLTNLKGECKYLLYLIYYEIWGNSYHLESRVGVETIKLNFLGQFRILKLDPKFGKILHGQK